MTFLVDAQLPPAPADWIVEQGHQAQQVHGFNLEGASDDEIWRLARDQGAVVVTKHRDVSDWAVSRSPRVAVLWIRFGKATNPALISRLTLIWQALVAALEDGADVVEARRP